MEVVSKYNIGDTVYDREGRKLIIKEIIFDGTIIMYNFKAVPYGHFEDELFSSLKEYEKFVYENDKNNLDLIIDRLNYNGLINKDTDLRRFSELWYLCKKMEKKFKIEIL